MPNDLLALDEVAHELNVSRRRVQAMVHAGQLPARQVGHQWVVPENALRIATHLLDRSPGRPVSAKNAWRLIEELGQGALRPGSMDELDSLRRRLRQRARHRDVYVHSSGLAELRELPEGVFGGRAAAIEAGAPLDDEGVVDLYLRELDYGFFVEPWGPEATDEGGNLRLHIVGPSAWPFSALDRFIPAWVAWLDLEDRRDRAADSLLDRLIGGRLIA